MKTTLCDEELPLKIGKAMIQESEKGVMTITIVDNANNRFVFKTNGRAM